MVSNEISLEETEELIARAIENPGGEEAVAIRRVKRVLASRQDSWAQQFSNDILLRAAGRRREVSRRNDLHAIGKGTSSSAGRVMQSLRVGQLDNPLPEAPINRALLLVKEAAVPPDPPPKSGK